MDDAFTLRATMDTTHSLMDASLGTDAVKKLIADYLAAIEVAGRSAMAAKG